MNTSKQQRLVTSGILAVAVAVTAATVLLSSPTAAPIAGPAAKPAQPVSMVPAPPEAPPQPPPQVEVVFALDATGSMSGLISGAKAKIWSVANKIVSGQPQPIVRFGLIAYRDHGDAYVTRSFPLTDDIDAMYEELMGVSAQGGGDGPEHVNKALSDAIYNMQWKPGKDVVRLVFLVGDAPPHDDYTDTPKSYELAEAAKERNITINTIRCGGDDNTEVAWRRIAQVGGGEFASIAQNGGVVAIATPYDEELHRLNAELADTVIAYGGADKRSRLLRKVSRRKSMEGATAASAASYGGKVGGHMKDDLLSDMDEGAVHWNTLSADEMPAEMQAAPDKKAWISAKKQDRKQLAEKIRAVSAKRDAYIKSEEASRGAEMSNSFDGNVVEMLRQQAASAGIVYE